MDRRDSGGDTKNEVDGAHTPRRNWGRRRDDMIQRFGSMPDKHRYMFYSLSVVAVGSVVLSALWIFMAGSQPVMMNRAFADSESKAAALEWLRRKQGVFHLDDPTLADTLARLVPSRMQAKSGGDLIEEARELNRLIDQHPALKELRELALSQKPPFQRVAIPVKIGLPEYVHHQPRQCTISVIDQGSLDGHRILLRNHQNGRELVLYGRGGITDPTASVDIHLNGEQLRYLFGMITGGTTVEGYAVILPGDGTLHDVPPTSCPTSENL